MPSFSMELILLPIFGNNYYVEEIMIGNFE